MSLAVKRLVPGGRNFPHEDVLRSQTGVLLRYWRRVSKGTTLNGAVVRTWTQPQSLMLLARQGFRYEGEEELAVVDAFSA